MRPGDQALEQLRRANPVPDPAALLKEEELAIAATRQEGRDPMNTVTTGAKRTTPSGKRGWSTGLVAAVVVLVLGIGTMTFLTGDGPFGGREMTPVEIAEAYMTAVDTYDSERALELLAEEVQITDAAYRQREELEAGFVVRERWGFTVSPFQCEQHAEEIVRCAYSLNGRLQEITDYPPIEASFRLTIRDGVVIQVNDGFPLGQFDRNVYSPFLRWLDTEHPGAFEALMYSIGGRDYPLLTPDALDLITVYVDLYEEWVNSQED